MARKPVLTGGKRDEIINVAMKLFFENGYEGTSVRMIMDAVGGEIGMFYHYFKSKDELFDRVVESFFRGYGEKFEQLTTGCQTMEEFVDKFLPTYLEAMARFGTIRGKLHWSIQYAMHDKTIASLVPAVISLMQRIDVRSETPINILAGQLVYGMSATLHSPDFEKMGYEEKRNCLMTYLNKVL